jgi:hypothetical protein
MLSKKFVTNRSVSTTAFHEADEAFMKHIPAITNRHYCEAARVSARFVVVAPIASMKQPSDLVSCKRGRN